MIKCYYDFSSTLPEEVRKWSQGQTYLECDDAFVYHLADEIKDTSKSLLPLHKICKHANMRTHTHEKILLLRNNLCTIKMCVAIWYSLTGTHICTYHMDLYTRSGIETQLIYLGVWSIEGDQSHHNRKNHIVPGKELFKLKAKNLLV